MRFELCIFTANDNDVRSGGNGIISVSRVIDNEHNLQKKEKEMKRMKMNQQCTINVYGIVWHGVSNNNDMTTVPTRNGMICSEWRIQF